MTIHYLYRDPYDSIEEQARIAAVEADTRRDIRIVWLQSTVKWSCVVLAYLTVVYFLFELGRGL
jgi:hypothetical protein